MTDLFLAARPYGQPEDDAERERRHQALAALLGAYADGELPAETSSHIDAHLLGCSRCRNELLVQHAISARLSRSTVPTATAAFQARIRYTLSALPKEAFAPAPINAPRSRWPWLAVVMCALVAVAGVATVMVRSQRPAAEPIPMVVASSAATVTMLFDEFRRLAAGELPGRARDLESVRLALPFAVTPLEGPDVHLLAAWTTDFNGEPAAVLAYRWHASVVLQFIISESLLFRPSEWRGAFAAGRSVAAQSGDVGLLAWPEANAGSVVMTNGPWSDLQSLTGTRGR